MEKKEILINDKKVTIMEQPTVTVLQWEKKYKNDNIGYARQILKYPSEVNPSLEDILQLPNELKYQDLTCEISLAEIENLFLDTIENKTTIFIAEKFLKKCKKEINDYKYNDLLAIGEELFNQIVNYGFIGLILNTFRNI